MGTWNFQLMLERRDMDSILQLALPCQEDEDGCCIGSRVTCSRINPFLAGARGCRNLLLQLSPRPSSRESLSLAPAIFPFLLVSVSRFMSLLTGPSHQEILQSYGTLFSHGSFGHSSHERSRATYQLSVIIKSPKPRRSSTEISSHIMNRRYLILL